MYPCTIQLFGPVQHAGALVESPNADWQFCGNALSASTKSMWFEFGYSQIIFARWLTVWTPNGNTARLVYMDDGPKEITGIVSVTGEQTTPIPQSACVGDVLNWLSSNKKNKQLGVQFAGNGQRPFTLYESRIELVFS